MNKLILWGVTAAMTIITSSTFAADADPYLWLEEVDGARALEWVKAQNAKTLAELQAAREYAPTYARSLAIYDSPQRIPSPSLRGNMIYNFWQDQAHERGLWRRATIASYRSAQPEWETLLDIDVLSKQEQQPWVFKGGAILPPDNRLCLVSLSKGGGDAAEVREFDTAAKAFVKDGFFLPAAKSRVAWRDADTLWVATDFGPGALTSSGYPRLIKLWQRGTPLTSARTVFEGATEDVSVNGWTVFTADGRYDLVTRSKTFFATEYYLLLGERLVRLPLPEDAELQEIFRDQILFSLRSDWTVAGQTYRSGTLLAIDLDDLIQLKRNFTTLFEPGARTSLDSVSSTRDRVLVTALDNVRGRLTRLAFEKGAWTREELTLPGLGTVTIASTDSESPSFFYTYQDFLTPSSLFLAEGAQAERVKSLPSFFDARGMRVLQYEATSRDGTRIPYFVVMPRRFVANGQAPTLLYGYGGFEVSQVPAYQATRGGAWLERGGVFALANIRGGGEFGPAWHTSALKQNRVKSFEDFAAVAEDLVARKITAPRHLGIMGGSNGGLLVGVMLTQRPELFQAIVCQVPLLDMRRYSRLLAGASWMAEFGDPDQPEDWAFIQTWSPYHNLKAGTRYPQTLFWTTTRDDRVHPGHARKMAAKMIDMGLPALYFENIEGGHGAGAVNKQRAQITALEYSYLWKRLR